MTPITRPEDLSDMARKIVIEGLQKSLKEAMISLEQNTVRRKPLVLELFSLNARVSRLKAEIIKLDEQIERTKKRV